MRRGRGALRGATARQPSRQLRWARGPAVKTTRGQGWVKRNWYSSPLAQAGRGKSWNVCVTDRRSPQREWQRATGRPALAAGIGREGWGQRWQRWPASRPAEHHLLHECQRKKNPKKVTKIFFNAFSFPRTSIKNKARGRHGVAGNERTGEWEVGGVGGSRSEGLMGGGRTVWWHFPKVMLCTMYIFKLSYTTNPKILSWCFSAAMRTEYSLKDDNMISFF